MAKEKILTKAEHEAAAREHEEECLCRAEAALKRFDEHWRAAVERAKAMPEGGLPSVWTTPVAWLASDLTKALVELGEDAESVKPAGKPDDHEKALPEHVRRDYRAGSHLRGALAAAVKARRHVRPASNRSAA